VHLSGKCEVQASKVVKEIAVPALESALSAVCEAFFGLGVLYETLNGMNEHQIEVAETTEQENTVEPEDGISKQESAKQLDDARHINATVETEKNESASPVKDAAKSKLELENPIDTTRAGNADERLMTVAGTDQIESESTNNPKTVTNPVSVSAEVSPSVDDAINAFSQLILERSDTPPVDESWIVGGSDPAVESARLHEEDFNLRHELNEFFWTLLGDIDRLKTEHHHGIDRNRSWINTDGIDDELPRTIAQRMYLTPIDHEFRTMACLVRERTQPCKFSMSGWSEGKHPYTDAVQGVINRDQNTDRVLELARILDFEMRDHKHDKRDRRQRPGVKYACHAELQLLAYMIWNNKTALARLRFLQKRKHTKSSPLLVFNGTVPPFDVYVCQPYWGGGACRECLEFYNEAARRLSLTIRLFVISVSGLYHEMSWSNGNGLHNFHAPETIAHPDSASYVLFPHASGPLLELKAGANGQFWVVPNRRSFTYLTEQR